MLDVLDNFKNQVNGNAQIQRIVKGWNTDVALEERDTATSWRLRVKEGIIQAVERSNPAANDDCPMRIVGEADAIRAVFEGRINGIRANNDGLIEIYGPMGDQVKLDAIALILWGL